MGDMQTLGLSDSTPHSENRLKSLFWPSIQTALDVDYLGAQGYWLCTLVAVVTFVLSTASGHPIAGVLTLLFYYLSGVGIREHSRYAAAIALVFSVADTLASPGVFRVLFAALLLSNVRATWIASGWKPESEEAAAPPRFGETWTDKFADLFPSWLWPKVRVLYYIFSVCFVVLVCVGMATVISRGGRQYRNPSTVTPRSIGDSPPAPNGSGFVFTTVVNHSSAVEIAARPSLRTPSGLLARIWSCRYCGLLAHAHTCSATCRQLCLGPRGQRV